MARKLHRIRELRLDAEGKSHCEHKTDPKAQYEAESEIEVRLGSRDGIQITGLAAAQKKPVAIYRNGRLFATIEVMGKSVTWKNLKPDKLYGDKDVVLTFGPAPEPPAIVDQQPPLEELPK